MDTTGQREQEYRLAGKRFRNKHTSSKNFYSLPSVAHLAPSEAAYILACSRARHCQVHDFISPQLLKRNAKKKNLPRSKTQRAPSNAAFSSILGVILIHRDMRRLPRFRIEDMAAFNGCVGRRVDCTHPSVAGPQSSPAAKH